VEGGHPGGGRAEAARILAALVAAASDHVQRDQPPGVPPLHLTGERTLPDVPAENYWFQRHLVAYEWVAERCRGLEVIDMACGEGYGLAALARRAARVVGVEANPEAFEHARAKYSRPGVRVARDVVERFAEPADAIVFLQTVEHLIDPKAVLDHFRSLVRPGGRVFVSTPNVLSLAPEGAERSGNPWHVHEYRVEEFRALCRGSFVELHGIFHAGRLRVHEQALAAGWDTVHRRLGVTSAFYERFTPALSVRDFSIRPESAGPLEGALDFLAVLR